MRFVNLIVSLAILTGLSGCATQGTTKLEPKETSRYIWQNDDGMHGISYNDTLVYYADTIAQTCYATIRYYKGTGMTPMNCADLAKREEWKKIITWVK